MEEKFTPTIEWMQEHYDKFNSLYFKNVLPHCEMKVFTTGSGSQGKTLGYFGFGVSVYVERDSRKMFVKNRFSLSNEKIYVKDITEVKPYIQLNGNYKATEDAWSNTLIHEMCHYYTYLNGYVPRQSHGTEFYAIGSKVCNLSQGKYVITRVANSEEMKNYELNAEVKAKNDQRKDNKISKGFAVITYHSNGAPRLTLTTSQSLVDDIVSYNKGKDTTKRIIVSKDSDLINLLFNKGYKHFMRTYKYWNIDKDLSKEIENYNYDEINLNESFSRRLDIIIENSIKEIVNNNEEDILISPDMNLGLQSPLETI